MQNLVVIINDPLVGMALLRTAAFWGRKCTVLSRYGCGYVKFASACKEFHEASEADIQNRLMQLLTELSLDAEENVFCAAGDISTRALIIASRDHGLKTLTLPSLTAFDQLYRKDNFDALCRQLDLPSPRTVVVEGREKLPAFLDAKAEIPMPLIVKPVSMSGGIGVRIVKTREELQEIICDVDYDHRPLVVQQYIEGEDIGLSLLSREGDIQAAYVQQRSSGGDRFPSRLDFVDLGARITAFTSYTGPAHIDARVDASGNLYLIEFNARFWASAELSTYLGIDLFTLSLEHEKAADRSAVIGNSEANLSIRSVISDLLKGASTLNSEARGFLKLIARDPIGFLITKSGFLRTAIS